MSEEEGTLEALMLELWQRREAGFSREEGRSLEILKEIFPSDESYIDPDHLEKILKVMKKHPEYRKPKRRKKL